jgi:hypothetical protein
MIKRDRFLHFSDNRNENDKDENHDHGKCKMYLKLCKQHFQNFTTLSNNAFQENTMFCHKKCINYVTPLATRHETVLGERINNIRCTI